MIGQDYELRRSTDITKENVIEADYTDDPGLLAYTPAFSESLLYSIEQTKQNSCFLNKITPCPH